MSDKPTQEQIDAVLKKFKEIQPKLPTGFSDNSQIIGAQISVLTDKMREGSIYNVWAGLKNPEVVNGAIGARHWLDGKWDSGFNDGPFEDQWDELVPKDGRT